MHRHTQAHRRARARTGDGLSVGDLVLGDSVGLLVVGCIVGMNDDGDAVGYAVVGANVPRPWLGTAVGIRLGTPDVGRKVGG